MSRLTVAMEGLSDFDASVPRLQTHYERFGMHTAKSAVTRLGPGGAEELQKRLRSALRLETYWRIRCTIAEARLVEIEAPRASKRLFKPPSTMSPYPGEGSS